MSRFGPDEPPARPIVAVLGPTATGKSALAVALAQRLAGEVVNADAMALYRGMDIGTAKPTLDTLDRRIEARVARMWAEGLLDEVARLVEVGLARGRTARTALGYAQALDQLAGRIDEAQARSLTTTATRRFARRQLSWLRPDPRITWLPADAPDLVDQALRVVGENG